MLTLFTTAKAFEGHSGVIQRNALQSWKQLGPDVEVILFGDDRGAAEVSAELELRHEARVERHESGMKYANYIFDRAQEIARHDVLCYLNCDIVQGPDFCAAVEKVRSEKKEFLMVGRRWDTDITEPISFNSPGWLENARKKAQAANFQRDEWFIDYFVFRRGFYAGRIPKLVIGRVYWDNWLLWDANRRGAVVVDASSEVLAIHQNHDYGYHKQGKAGVWNDALAQRNLELAGGTRHLHSIRDAKYRLTVAGVRKKRMIERLMGPGRVGWRNRVWHPFLDWTRPVRHAIGLRLGTSSHHAPDSGKKL